MSRKSKKGKQNKPKPQYTRDTTAKKHGAKPERNSAEPVKQKHSSPYTVLYFYPESSWKTELRSDTLWGLICWGIRWLEGNEALEELFKEYPRFSGNKKINAGAEPPFLLTSAFPFRENDDESIIRYYPRPLRAPDYQWLFDKHRNKPEDAMKQLKKLKKIKYLHEKLFVQELKGELVFSALQELDKTPAPKKELVTHGSLDRWRGSTREVDDKGQLFQTEEYFAKEKTGLFALLKTRDAKDDIYKNLVLGALRLMQQTGLGGDRSTGKGFFRFEQKGLDADSELVKHLEDPNAHKQFMSLSLCAPLKDQLDEMKKKCEAKDGPEFSYELEARAGKTGYGLSGVFQKRRLVMFREGSVLPALAEQNSVGGLFDVTPAAFDAKESYDIQALWQYACAFPVPLASAPKSEST